MWDSDSDPNLSGDIEDATRNVVHPAPIPEKSKPVYDSAYERFEKWCEREKVEHINEEVLLAYFECKKNFKASTLWTQFSMLRAELSSKKGIDIKTYKNLIAFLRRQSVGYHAKKSNVFSKVNIAKFLTEVDDNKFLMSKVALIVGIVGACGKSELTFLRTEDIADEESYFRVHIPNTKTNVIREYIITPGDIEGVNFVDIIRKYRNLRPVKVKHNRFFVKYENGKCGVQPVGINTIGQLPRMIAQLIGLPNPALFTGHCFRRSSAILFADSGANFLKIKQYGDWKLKSAVKRCADNSIENKRISANISGTSNNIPQNISAILTNETASRINFTNCNNCVVNIHI